MTFASALTVMLLGVSGSPEVVVVGARVEVGDGTVIDSATVVMDDGRITRIDVGGAIPPGAEVVRAEGRVLTPGLIESYSQLGLSEVGLEDVTNDHELAGAAAVPAFRAADGYNPMSVRIPINRTGGVTTAIVRPRGQLIHGTGSVVDLVQSLDAMPDPERPVAMFGSVDGGAIRALGGARGGVWLRLREIVADTRFYAQNRGAYDRGGSRPLALSPLHLEAMIPVVTGKLPLVLEVDRSSDILKALSFARTEGITLIISGGAEAWMVAGAIREAGVPVILRPSKQLPWHFSTLAARDDAPALLHAAGVELIVTSGSWDQNLRRLRQEAGIAVANGLPREAALATITRNPARAFGLADRIGTVAVGKRANLVLWSGDPLELETVAVKIWIDGRELPIDDRQMQLARRYLQLAPD